MVTVFRVVGVEEVPLQTFFDVGFQQQVLDWFSFLGGLEMEL